MPVSSVDLWGETVASHAPCGLVACRSFFIANTLAPVSDLFFPRVTRLQSPWLCVIPFCRLLSRSVLDPTKKSSEVGVPIGGTAGRNCDVICSGYEGNRSVRMRQPTLRTGCQTMVGLDWRAPWSPSVGLKRCLQHQANWMGMTSDTQVL